MRKQAMDNYIYGLWFIFYVKEEEKTCFIKLRDLKVKTCNTLHEYTMQNKTLKITSF